jgi:hypothetical protein
MIIETNDLTVSEKAELIYRLAGEFLVDCNRIADYCQNNNLSALTRVFREFASRDSKIGKLVTEQGEDLARINYYYDRFLSV